MTIFKEHSSRSVLRRARASEKPIFAVDLDPFTLFRMTIKNPNQGYLTVPSNPASGDQGHADADEDGAGPAQGRDGFIEKIYGQKRGEDVAQGGEGQDKTEIGPGQDGQPEEEETGQEDNTDDYGRIGKNFATDLDIKRPGYRK